MDPVMIAAGHLERQLVLAAARRRLMRFERAVDRAFDRHQSLKLDRALQWFEFQGAAA
jgi:hypothetical protein